MSTIYLIAALSCAKRANKLRVNLLKLLKLSSLNTILHSDAIVIGVLYSMLYAVFSQRYAIYAVCRKMVCSYAECRIQKIENRVYWYIVHVLSTVRYHIGDSVGPSRNCSAKFKSNDLLDG
jgi:hypothetical protein